MWHHYFSMFLRICSFAFWLYEACTTETCTGVLTGDGIAVVRKKLSHTYSDSSPIEAQARICLKHCHAHFCTL